MVDMDTGWILLRLVRMLSQFVDPAPILFHMDTHHFASIGLSVGLSAINGIGREMREQSQEREIMRERQELSEAKMKAAELEGRLRALEAR